GDRTLQAVLLGGFAVRILVILADMGFGLFPKFDALLYHRGAAAFAETVSDPSTWNTYNYKRVAYEAAIAVPYALFGPSFFLGRATNAALSMLAAYNVFRIGRTLHGRAPGLAALAAFAFLPTIVWIHGELLRESLTILIVTQVVYLALAGGASSPAGGVAVFLCVAYLALLRRETLFIVVLFLLALAAVTAFRGPSPWLRGPYGRRRLLVGAGVVFVGAAVLQAFAAQFGLVDFFAGFGVRVADIDYLRRSWTGGGSAYLRDWRLDSWGEVALFLPAGVAHFLLVPFPWDVHNAVAFFAAVENLLLFYPLVALGIAGVVRGARTPAALALAAYFVLGIVAYGLVEGNAGTALRHRMQFTWVLFVFAGPAVARLGARVLAGARLRYLSTREVAAPEKAT
ncbi:MAG: hypothetical protein ACT4PT_03375, partial [Methanobacteriota archaeon]